MNHINPSDHYIRQSEFKKTVESKKEKSPASPVSDSTNLSRAEDVIVSLSDTSREIQIAKSGVASSSDIREEKVNEIKKLISENRYEIKAKDIAEKMIGSFIDELI